MSARGDCYDNAFAESLFAALKNELMPEGRPFDTKAGARIEIFDCIETFCNRARLHSALGYRSPDTFLEQPFANQNSQLN